MSRSTFHQFPNLPVEIRLQIWEDACFDWGSGRFGLHYIRLNENRQLAPLNCNWETTGRNRSAYLWHAGLWTACKESRDIVAKHWSDQGWPDIQQNTKDKSLGDVIWVESEPFPPPIYLRKGLIHRKGDYEAWHQVADMERDIFCVTAESWEPLVRNWKPLHIEAEDEWGRHFIDDVMNVAVEFDPSWYQTIEKFSKDNPISDYPPSLAFLIKLLFDQAHNKRHRKLVQLIDRNVLWHVSDERLNLSPPIYIDCDHEYLEIPSHRLKRDSPLSRFLSLLDILIGDKLTKIEYGEPRRNYGPSESDWEQDDRLPPEELMEFVVRRDNLRPWNLIR
ncbi:hypothetical protein FVEG_17503 [Fusarium verticillioides 7600]|uniref:2EXR domain-containing protein n=1 Tax=Gibberella moniliformis (strain M3125 / FGSC 7600) TaxID=334819 RepID=W7NGA5_GIBM7|nr:hypothetical protein FVEG_17503 [Fusarium verticillioides 7600]EWG55317.1 hypothetical protein FVEG_17503 [Fusarium verticillioides 7600]